ncbi:periplasmic protein [Rubripirellula obstinata]|uniref:Periplasmic protein n=1 Tax=Rubripirellula obstinata TaxID=406547 RepID=A0A5B1CIW3_9BACT|nr:BON domain-containing protein [Rubripirellula obstinata]KAA1259224.1 periplasmic protein [Rubripirellula obstinata]
MRRKKLLIAIAALASLGPIQAQAAEINSADANSGDREIAQQIMQRLKSNRDSGALKDFTLDMKVDQGVVLFRGNVNANDQKQLVLQAASGIEGIAKVVDEVSVTQIAAPVPKAEMATEPPEAVVLTPKPVMTATEETPEDTSGFSFSQALASEAQVVRQLRREPLTVVPGVVQPVAAMEDTNSDQNVVSAVVSALGRAQNAGQLKGFGVDVQCNDGVVELTGRAASPEQRNTILRIAERTPGVSGVRESIAVPTAAPSLKQLPEVETLQAPQQSPQPRVPAQLASAPIQQAAPLMNPAPMNPAPMQQMQMQHAPMQQAPVMQAAPYRMQGQTQAMATGFGGGGGMMGTPVPMAPHAPVGAPRYDSPNLPNYAWPGYAANSNYAAVTYPQQYSPTAWPFIGPFYPYPQVPLGWRKVSLEWDDGWWFLDFTDR